MSDETIACHNCGQVLRCDEHGFSLSKLFGRRAAYLKCAEIAERAADTISSLEGAAALVGIASLYRQMAEGRE